MEPTAPKAVFLSYASQDADAARRIAQALRAEGIEVWFDESALGGGEAWDASIRRQIRDCALFVAIVSANTQARKEGYFRLEWKLADERSQLIAEGTPFVLPVIIDGTKERDALVPKSFLGVQWTWLPHGEVPPGFVARVQRLLYPAAAGATPTKPSFGEETSTPTSPTIVPLPVPKESDEPSTPATRRVLRADLVFAAGALTMLAAVTLVVGLRDGSLGALTGGGTRGSADAGVTRFTIALAPGQAVLSRPAISRDGRMIAYTAGLSAEEPKLYLRRLAESESREVSDTNGASQPFFSPDGRSVAFFANGRLFRWSIGGGAPVPLSDAPRPVGGTWGEDDTIVFAPVWNGGLFRVPAAGGRREVLLRPDGKQDYAFVFPRFIPGRQEILFTAWGKNEGVWRMNLSTGARSAVMPNADSGLVTTSGHLLAGAGVPSPDALGFRPGVIATSYRENALSSHAPTLVVPNVNYAAWQPDLWSDVSATGTLAYVPADARARSIVLVDLTGKIEVLSTQPGSYARLSVSPTTRRLVADADYRVWLYAPDGTSRERLAPDNRDGDEFSPMWTRDGKAVVYTSNESGNWDIYRRIPGVSKSEVLLAKELDQTIARISPDGMIAYDESHPITGYDIWLLSPDGKTRPWLVSPKNERPGPFSPNGKWLVYRSDESGRYEIYVKPVEGDMARVQVSTAGGGNAVWKPDGSTLFYQEAGAMWEMELGSGEAPSLGQRRKLFEGGWALNPPGEWDYCEFDVMPDGKHFVMIRGEPKSIPDRINVVVNWYDELRRLVPVK